ncbi:MAG: helix-turn-helix domain-containing protein [Caulobacterales bacterium]|uniref:helix-turn-helix domain-containing protein n=1 Tax=Glycocaulis sp. TaxID=1969725 RepID=UPI003FA007E1
MSNKATGHVWASGLFEGAGLLVALKLADHADDDGWCWPAMSTLAKMTGLAPRSVRRILRQMEKAELLTVDVRRGRGRVNRYQMQLAGFEAAEKAWKAMECRTRFATTKAMRESVLLQSVKEDIRSAFLNAVKADSGGTKADIDDRKSGHGSPIEPSIEPPRENARAREASKPASGPGLEGAGPGGPSLSAQAMAGLPAAPDRADPPPPELDAARFRTFIRERVGPDMARARFNLLRIEDGRLIAPNEFVAADLWRDFRGVLTEAGVRSIRSESNQKDVHP